MYDLHKKHGKKQRIWTCVKNMYTNNKYSSKTAVPDCVISVKLVTIAWRDRVTYNECTCIPPLLWTCRYSRFARMLGL